MEKILTVVIPAYNVEKYLRDGVQTFLHEDILDDIEIFIVNDGSKDNTAEIGMELQRKYPGTIVLINKKNGGHGSTINEGIRHASGKYFKVIDGDDWVDTVEFVNYVNDLKKIDADIVMTPFVKVNDETGAKERKEFKNITFYQKYCADRIIDSLKHLYQMHSITFRTNILKRIPKISEHCFYVDQEYIIYPLMYIDTMIFLKHQIYQYRVGNNEQSISKKNMQKNRDMHLRVTKHIISLFCSGEFEGAKKEFLKDRIRGLCLQQIEIYLSMDSKVDAKKELNKFTEYLKETVSDLYDSLPGKKMWLLRISGNKFYDPIAVWIRRREK